jgi:RNA polymerase sigma-70 factor, ECF subfamily
VEIEAQSDSRSDEELVAAVNRGEAGAFDVLYYRHRDWVVNLAFRFSGDRELALDVLQETFLYLAKKFPGFRLTARLQTFLYPAVRNLSLTARRKAERLQSDESALAELEAPPPGADAAGGREQLAAVLESLSEQHREVLLLRFVDGLSLNEIAAAMDIPLGTVKSRLHNALDTLRQDQRTKIFFDR